MKGTFKASSEVKELSSAPHFNQPSTAVTIRFSNSTGLPEIPDTDPNANPRGLAIRFNLADHPKRVHTDIVIHSTPYFPTRTGAEFLEFLKALVASQPGTPSPTPVEQFLDSHPGAKAFVQAPKAAPTSFGKEAYYGVNAFKFSNAKGKETYFRYRAIPEAGEENVEEEALKHKAPNFLFEELPKRLKAGAISFKLMAQLAEEGDTTDDATVHWPESRPLVELGTIKVESILPDNAKEQKSIIFDPIPRVQGIEVSNDPLRKFYIAMTLAKCCPFRVLAL